MTGSNEMRAVRPTRASPASPDRALVLRIETPGHARVVRCLDPVGRRSLTPPAMGHLRPARCACLFRSGVCGDGVLLLFEGWHARNHKDLEVFLAASVLLHQV